MSLQSGGFVMAHPPASKAEASTRIHRNMRMFLEAMTSVPRLVSRLAWFKGKRETPTKCQRLSVLTGMMSSLPSSPRRRLMTVAFPRSLGSTGGSSRGGLSRLTGFKELGVVVETPGVVFGLAAGSCLFQFLPSQMKTMSFFSSTLMGMNSCLPVNLLMMGIIFLTGILTPENVTT